jgi:hypothetical protein
MSIASLALAAGLFQVRPCDLKDGPANAERERGTRAPLEFALDGLAALYAPPKG